MFAVVMVDLAACAERALPPIPAPPAVDHPERVYEIAWVGLRGEGPIPGPLSNRAWLGAVGSAVWRNTSDIGAHQLAGLVSRDLAANQRPGDHASWHLRVLGTTIHLQSRWTWR